ncbi:MAG: UDP-N-acetylmuramoyl-L-alanyl-D-glutamate--2,6-diaminopimelate ligase [Alphaproteobacteria bacterium]|nr:UDP-N-acetylmuramoyl-L-alanyl-D-glutamate--2,6-diaminopimelate ligase [Alphaproteobacteria bacterium]
MKLSKIINTQEEIEIKGITSDSREVKSGYLFGSLNSDEYVKDAISKGASAIIVSSEYSEVLPEDVIVIKSDNPALTYAQAVAKYYGKVPANLCAVTGTNGKTSIVDFVRQVLTKMGYKAASIGTLGLIKGGEEALPSPNTTPNNVALHKQLKSLAEDDFAYVAMEASSHGLHQYRMGGLTFKVAAFTNLTRDHLDYHKTFEEYLDAKLILFKQLLSPDGTAVLNADVDVYGKIADVCRQRGQKIISYGTRGSDIKLLCATPSEKGQKLEIEYFGQPQTIEISQVGEFQAMNILCALGILSAITGLPDDVIHYMSDIKGAKGRLEHVADINGASVYIDYAHTPDALENALKALRPHVKGKLHVLFGCGGNRDAGKRPIMGQIAHQYADVIYITDDNPRFEEAEDIRNEIILGCPGAYNIADRAKAIKTAIQSLETGDILVLAGKGHETGQYIKGEIIPFSDHEEVAKNI